MSSHPSRLAWLVADPDRVADVALEDVPSLMGVLAEIGARLQLRLNTPSLPPQEQKPHQDEDRLLTITEAAQRINVRPRWIYSCQKRLPFVRRLGARTLRVSEQGLEKWLVKSGQRE